jgi:hypothetical protein
MVYTDCYRSLIFCNEQRGDCDKIKIVEIKTMYLSYNLSILFIIVFQFVLPFTRAIFVPVIMGSLIK